MAKDQKPVEQMDALSKQAMAQAHEALDVYFDFLKKSVSSFPSGGTELGEKLKAQSLRNITAVQDLVKRFSQAKDFEEALRIQTEFMQSQLNAFGEQIKSLARRMPKKRQVGSRCRSKVRLISALFCSCRSCPAFTNPILVLRSIAPSRGTQRIGSSDEATG
jgi:hypothetical protein